METLRPQIHDHGFKHQAATEPISQDNDAAPATPKFQDATAFADALSGIRIESFDGAEAWQQALAAARALVRRLETPVETAWELSFGVPALYSALRAAHDNDVFEILDEDNGRAKSTAELSSRADPGLMFRILRHLAASHIIEQVGPDLWKGTTHSSDYRRPEVFAAVEYANLISFDSYRAMPSYWRSVDYKPPESRLGSWQHFTGKKDQLFYDWVAERPEAQECFTNLMKVYTSQRGSWMDVYPTESLISSADAKSQIIVDIGAGSGHDLWKYVQKHPEAAGRLTFQDQKHVVEAAAKEPRQGLIGMAVNFFEPQPVQGARAYFLHSILHNWPDDECRQILQNVKQAMRKNYSVVLINEMIMPDVGADRFQTSLDIGMTSILNARERSEKEWTAFMSSAGFKILKFWRRPGVYDGVVEAVPVEWDD